MENNTIIAINNGADFVSSKMQFSSIVNLSIVGYHMVVEIMCRNNTLIEFKNCNNIVIENITWNECGYNVDSRSAVSYVESYELNFDDHFNNYYFLGISFAYCTNICLKFCTFKNSMIGFDTDSGTVNINHVKFISNDTSDSFYSLATGLLINQTNDTVANNDAVVKITNSLFTQTEETCNNQALLVMYILVNDPNSTIKIFVNQTNFSSASYDPGWAAENGMAWIRILSCKDAYVKFYGVNFYSNNFTFDNAYYHHDISAILLRIHIPSTYRFIDCLMKFDILSNVTIESCSFLNNAG